jgi:hypothetical protein
MLERIKLFRNKNKLAGEAQKAEQGIQKQSEETAEQDKTEQQYEQKQINGGQKR